MFNDLSNARLRNEAARLERENGKMEQRLQELRDSLRRQKQERLDNGGYSWKKGEKGTIRKHATDVLDDNSQRREKGRRIKVLPPAPARPPALPKSKARAARLRTVKPSNPSSAHSSKSSIPSADPSTLASRASSVAAAHPKELEDYIAAEHGAFLDALNEWRTGTPARLVETGGSGLGL